MNKKLWNEFLNGKAVINCATENEAAKFMKLCKENNIKWSNGDETITRYSEWEDYKEQTCYSNNFDSSVGLGYGNTEFWQKEKLKIVTYTELMEDKKTFTGPELAQMIRDKKYKEGTKFKDRCDIDCEIKKYVGGELGIYYPASGNWISSISMINGTFTLIEEPKLIFLNQAVKEGKRIKLKDWDCYYVINEVLDWLRWKDIKTIQNALTKKVWEIEE